MKARTRKKNRVGETPTKAARIKSPSSPSSNAGKDASDSSPTKKPRARVRPPAKRTAKKRAGVSRARKSSDQDDDEEEEREEREEEEDGKAEVKKKQTKKKETKKKKGKKDDGEEEVEVEGGGGGGGGESKPLDPDNVEQVLEELLATADKFKTTLGGGRKAKPRLNRKITRREYMEQYSDYEYIYLQALGFLEIHKQGATIRAKNNGLFFTQNPGTQLLEKVAGITMHGDRPGANALVESAPSTLCKAFLAARADGKKPTMLKFFRSAFDRNADPCLEGRVSLLLRYLEELPNFQEAAGTSSVDGVPWADTCLDLRAKLDAKGLVGEYLRVFTNSKLAEFAKEKDMKYAETKTKLSEGELPGFEDCCNATAFYDHLCNAGVISDYVKPSTSSSSTSTSTSTTSTADAKHKSEPPVTLTSREVKDIIQFYVQLETLAE